MSCLPDPEIDITPYLEYVEGKVRKICPDLSKHIERTETFGVKMFHLSVQILSYHIRVENHMD